MTPRDYALRAIEAADHYNKRTLKGVAIHTDDLIFSVAKEIEEAEARGRADVAPVAEKIVFLDPGKVSVPALLGQIGERAGVDAMIAAVRVDGRWMTVWGGGLTLGQCAMGAMKLFGDVAHALESE